MYRIQLDPGPWAQYVKRADNVGLPLQEVTNKYIMESNLYSTQLFEALQQQQQSQQSAVAAGASTSVEVSGPVGGSGTIVFNGLDPQSGGSYVSAPGATINTWLPSTGDFTVEWFQYQTVGGGHPRVFSIGPDTQATFGVSIEANKVYTWPTANNWSIGTTYVNTWVHIALVRSSGVMNAFINGVKKTTYNQADTTDVSGAVNDLYIGADGLTAGDGFPGNITNFRWTNSAVYTTNFDTPTSPLSSLSQTKLLLLGGSTANPVVDATGTNVLTNFNTTWSADTPFV
jgi:hypothetical protein